MKILIVEDKQEWMDPLADAMKKLLPEFGLNPDILTVVCNGRKTAEDTRKLLNGNIANGEKYDIAILDLRLEERPNIHYLNPFKPDVYEGIEIYETYKNILGKVIFSAIPENINIAASIGFDFSDTPVCFKDFSWDGDEKDEFPNNVIAEVKKIIVGMQHGDEE